MDNLLRRHLRRSASSVASAKDAVGRLDAARESAAHMDADELSAYAEGALPDAARLRYATHLADCDSCRRIVTELVVSSSSLEMEESGSVAQTVEAPSRSWRERLASLFSPPVLRYAAPALALFAFVAIVLVVATRNRDEVSFVAKNEPNRQQPANSAAEAPKEGTSTGSTAASDNSNNHGNTSTANSSGVMQNPVASPAQSPQREDATAPPPPAQADGVSSADSARTTDVTVEEQQQKLNDQERSAATKQPAPSVQSNSPTDTYGNRAKEKDDASLAAQKRQDSNEVTTGGAAVAGAAPVNGRRSRSETKNSGGLGATSESASDERKKTETMKRAPATTARPRRDTTGADEDAAETRTVAGKRFRQQNGIWVDASYNSSRSLVRVKRGSEQYSALVADEPVIGTVSNAFGGQSVIVVVKSRAYHIY
ncbi:MAG TPA: zf-HC2 domain-containing protein [Pyrinomonadaceae bacterium]